MPIERFRDVGEMPRRKRLGGAALLEAIAAAWERAHIRVRPDVPRGVMKYRSVEEAQQARHRRIVRRMRDLATRGAEPSATEKNRSDNE